MKSIGRLKLISLIVHCLLALTLVMKLCQAEPYFSSKANITPVKLFQIAPRNTSSSPTHNGDPVIGSLAKISRVVPLRHVPKIGNNFRHGSYSNVNRVGNHSSVTRRKHTTLLENKPRTPATFALSSPPPTKFPNRSKPTKSSVIERKPFAITTSIATTSTNAPSTPTAHTTNKNPLFLSSDSWDYLNSVVSDEELQEIINGIPEEVIKNVSVISRQDSLAGQNFLMKNIISALKKMKQSRMLAIDTNKQNNKKVPVNTGVRFSAKQKRPVLNVIPLEQKINLGKPTKTLMKTGVIGKWNISGLLNNDEDQNIPDPVTDVDFKPSHQENNQEKNANKISSVFKVSSIHPGSTPPSLMKVLAVPDSPSLSSTSSPFLPVPSNLKSGFLPINPTENVKKAAESKEIPVLFGAKLISLDNNNSNFSETGMFPPRKPRVPPKDDEYQIPSITTSSTSSPDEANNGYQTITESTTPGPKVIWYNHNQTPEDTFYPNSDTFLIPPEESSIEMIELASLKPVQDNPSIFSSEVSYESKGKIKRDKKIRPVLHYNSNEHYDGNGRDNWGTRKSIIKDNKKTNKNVQLQPAATSDHDNIRDYYEENRGGGGRNERKRYGPASYNSYENEIRQHEIIPRHQKTNRKPPPPPPYREHDTESYGALNEDDHYHDTYPHPHALPLVSTKHEIMNPYRYRVHPLEENIDDGDHYKTEVIRPLRERYRDDEPTPTDSEYFSKPKEPKYRLKEPSPYHAQSYGHNQNNQNNNGYQGGHGWKDPSNFFSKAKDYLKHSELNTMEKWFDVSIGVLAFLAFGGYIIMLLYQVFTISSSSATGTLFGRSIKGIGEIFDVFFSKGPMGEAYMDELETIVKRAMANVKRIWVTNSFAEKMKPRVKGEEDAK